MCKKMSYWSNNYTQYQYDNCKKIFGDSYLKYKSSLSYEQNLQFQIIEYKSLDNDEIIVHYFGDD